MTVRWTFAEVGTTETYTMAINPDSMTSPTQDKNLTTAFAIADGRLGGRTFRSRAEAKEWEFSGVIRTQAFHDALEAWSRKPGKVRITDHLGRTFEVMFTSFEPVDRKPTPSVPWRLRYTMKTLLFRRIA